MTSSPQSRSSSSDPSIQALREDGHQVLATSRKLQGGGAAGVDGRARPLLRGFQGREGPSGSVPDSLERMERLLPIVVDFSPDASVSVASPDCARVSFGLRIRHVAVNDSPHSLVAGKLSCPSRTTS